LYGKPRNVRDFTKSQGSVSEKILSGKRGLKLFIDSCIFASIRVFNRSVLLLFACFKYKYKIDDWLNLKIINASL